MSGLAPRASRYNLFGPPPPAAARDRVAADAGESFMLISLSNADRPDHQRRGRGPFLDATSLLA
jgi:hypothetical protein